MNMDDSMVQPLATLGADDLSSVGLYQLLFQRWKSRPGVLAPRTLILTDTTVFLCAEDHGGLGRGNPRLAVIDQSPLSEVASVRPDEAPDQVTIFIKRTLKHKRWRLVTSNRRNAERLVSEVRRCIGAGDRDSDDDDESTFFDSSRASISGALSSSIRASLPSAPSLFSRNSVASRK